jgi:hypothetical protein
MKHIQKFEAYHPDDDKYYTLLDRVGHGNMPKDLLKDALPMSDEEVRRISSLFPPLYKCDYTKSRIYLEDEHTIHFLDIPTIKCVRDKGCIIQVYKLEDEWFILSMADIKGKGRIYFKVDQFDGLKYIIDKTCVKSI